jgi:hypothetical protein
MLIQPAESHACLAWIRNLCNRCRGIYTPPVATACAPVPTTVQYIPETHFRNVEVQVPVTTMRPVVVGCNPCTGGLVTCMRPETVNQTQVRGIPYTTYRLVTSQPAVVAPTVQPAVATCAPVCTPICGTCSTAAVATTVVPQANTVTRVITPGFTTAPTFGTAPSVNNVPSMNTAPAIIGTTPNMTTGPVTSTVPTSPLNVSPQPGGFPTIPTAPTVVPNTNYPSPGTVTGPTSGVGPQTPTPSLRPVDPQTSPYTTPVEPKPQLSPRIVPIPDHEANTKVDPTSTHQSLTPDNRTTQFPIKRSGNVSTVSQKSVRTQPPQPQQRGWAPAPTWRPDDSGWQASGERP